MGATVRQPISKARRIVSLLGLLVVVLVLVYDLRANPEFGPPIIFGFSLGLVGLAGGAALAAVFIGWRWFRDAGLSGGANGRKDRGLRREV